MTMYTAKCKYYKAKKLFDTANNNYFKTEREWLTSQGYSEKIEGWQLEEIEYVKLEEYLKDVEEIVDKQGNEYETAVYDLIKTFLKWHPNPYFVEIFNACKTNFDLKFKIIKDACNWKY